MEISPLPNTKGHKITATGPIKQKWKTNRAWYNLTYHLVILLQQVKKGEEREGRSKSQKGLNKILTKNFKHTSKRDKLSRSQMQYCYDFTELIKSGPN